MLTALGSLHTQQSKGKEKTYAETFWLLNYAATHPNADIRYTASIMILYIYTVTSPTSMNLNPAAVQSDITL